MAKYTGVFQNSDGSWSYRIKKHINGQLIDKRIKLDENGCYFKTAKEAYEAKLRHEIRLKEITPTVKKYTLESVYNSYMESADAKQKAPATIKKQNSMWKNWIKPKFGNRDINSILITELDSFLLDLYSSHSFAYVEGFLKFFYLLWGFAYRLEAINPDKYYRMFGDNGTRLTMPKKTQDDIEDDIAGAVFYTDDELSVMEAIFKSEDGNLLTAFYLGIYCGLRISECFGLRWQNIDWENKRIIINRQMHYTDGRLTLSPVKTMKAIRFVIIPSFLQDYLDTLYQQQREEESTAQGFYRNTERVYDEVSKEWIIGGDFVNRKHNGELLTVNSMKYWSKKIKNSPPFFIDFKYHNLRHTYAKNCALNNVNLQLLMDMMGHKKLDTTKKYYISTDDMVLQNKTLKILNNMYNFHGNIVEAPDIKNYYETINSKGFKTKYILKK